MFVKFLFYFISGTIGLFIAVKYIPGIYFYGTLKDFLIAGACLGVINLFIKPIIKLIALPLRILTFGLFGLIINIGLIFLIVKVIFPNNFILEGLFPLIYTTIIIWLVNFLFGLKK